MELDHAMLVNLRTSLAGLAVSFVGLWASQAVSQTVIEPPKPYQLADARGVDLMGLGLSVSTSTIAIGDPAQGGLSFSASYDSNKKIWEPSTYGGIYRKDIVGPGSPGQEYQWYKVTVLGQTVSFRDDGFGVLELLEGSGSGTLTQSPTTYTYTAGDGTVATFDRGKSSYHPYRANEGLLTRIVRPDGEVIEFTYTAGLSGSIPTQRLQGVANNLGYAIHFDYASDTAGTTAWSDIAKVTAFNRGVDYCAPSAFTCAFSQTWPSLTFAQTASQQTVTDSLNRQLRVITNLSGQVTGVARPATTTGQDLTINWTTGPTGTRVSSVSDGVGVWTYGRTDPLDPGDAYYTTVTTITDPLSHVTKYEFEWYDPWGDQPFVSDRLNRLIKVTDALNQVTPLRQDAAGTHMVTAPEGDRTDYTYHQGVLASVTRTPKPSSPLAPNTIVRTFGDCSTVILCGRPTSVTDARGAVSNFTYDAAGNLLMATSPAPASGADRPQTRHGYQQLYAWYFQGGSTRQQAPTPVWRRVRSSTCATGAPASGSTPAACVGTADEVVTTTAYQAGSSSIPSNLLPVAVTTASGDGALTATATTTYDAVGNVLSVNGPLPGSSDTTRYVWDAMRQQIGEIGPDPDGAP